MPLDPNFARYTPEEMNEMREARKQEADRKREQLTKDITPYVSQFERLFLKS